MGERRQLEEAITVQEWLRPSTRIKDLHVFSARDRCLGPLQRGFVWAFFTLRHKNLLERFGDGSVHGRTGNRVRLAGSQGSMENLT